MTQIDDLIARLRGKWYGQAIDIEAADALAKLQADRDAAIRAAIAADRRGRTFSPDEIMQAEQRGYDRCQAEVVAWLENQDAISKEMIDQVEAAYIASAIKANAHKGVLDAN